MPSEHYVLLPHSLLPLESDSLLLRSPHIAIFPQKHLHLGAAHWFNTLNNWDYKHLNESAKGRNSFAQIRMHNQLYEYYDCAVLVRKYNKTKMGNQFFLQMHCTFAVHLGVNLAADI